MSLTTEMSAAVLEVVNLDPSTVYDQRGNVITARVQRSIETDTALEPAGQLYQTDISVTIPADNLPSPAPGEDEEIMIDSAPHRITTVSRSSGVANRLRCLKSLRAAHAYWSGTDGGIVRHTNGLAATT